MRPSEQYLYCRRPGRNSRRGFTLLEVLVAMTITGMALGALLGVIGGNKRLAWTGEEALQESTRVRSRINFAQLNDERGEILVDFPDHELVLHDAIELPIPQRKTEGSIHALRGYEVRDSDGTLIVDGTYWVELGRPE